VAPRRLGVAKVAALDIHSALRGVSRNAQMSGFGWQSRNHMLDPSLTAYDPIRTSGLIGHRLIFLLDWQ